MDFGSGAGVICCVLTRPDAVRGLTRADVMSTSTRPGPLETGSRLRVSTAGFVTRSFRHVRGGHSCSVYGSRSLRYSHQCPRRTHQSNLALRRSRARPGRPPRLRDCGSPTISTGECARMPIKSHIDTICAVRSECRSRRYVAAKCRISRLSLHLATSRRRTSSRVCSPAIATLAGATSHFGSRASMGMTCARSHNREAGARPSGCIPTDWTEFQFELAMWRSTCPRWMS